MFCDDGVEELGECLGEVGDDFAEGLLVFEGVMDGMGATEVDGLVGWFPLLFVVVGAGVNGGVAKGVCVAVAGDGGFDHFPVQEVAGVEVILIFKCGEPGVFGVVEEGHADGASDGLSVFVGDEYFDAAVGVML